MTGHADVAARSSYVDNTASDQRFYKRQLYLMFSCSFFLSFLCLTCFPSFFSFNVFLRWGQLLRPRGARRTRFLLGARAPARPLVARRRGAPNAAPARRLQERGRAPAPSARGPRQARGRRWGRRKRFPAAVAPLGGIGVGVLGALRARPPPPTTGERREARGRPSRRRLDQFLKPHRRAVVVTVVVEFGGLG